MLAKQMLSVIVFSSFVLFAWAAIISIIYKTKFSQYRIIKK